MPDQPPPAQLAGGPTGAQLKAASATLALLSVPTRLHLMWLLARREYDVGTLATRTGASVAAVSQHLAKLRLAGLVRAHRDGRRQIYTVEDPHLLTVVDQILDHIAPDGTLAPDPPDTVADRATRRSLTDGPDQGRPDRPPVRLDQGRRTDPR
jgi:DNA-binding transcriptional ArsR family regulator